MRRPAPLRRAETAGSRQGVSIVEFLVASTMTLVGVASYLTTIVKVDDLRRDGEGVATAFEACQLQVATLRSTPFAELVARYDADSGNDPVAGAPGATFAVSGLSRRSDPGAEVGAIVLPLDTLGRLREDLVMPELGMPMDLNGDGVIDSDDHSGDYVVLPVLVRVRWDESSRQSAEFKTILCDRR